MPGGSVSVDGIPEGSSGLVRGDYVSDASCGAWSSDGGRERWREQREGGKRGCIHLSRGARRDGLSPKPWMDGGREHGDRDRRASWGERADVRVWDRTGGSSGDGVVLNDQVCKPRIREARARELPSDGCWCGGAGVPGIFHVS